MMKDILAKLSALEASAPKVTKKKMLTEDSTTPPVKPSTKPATLKDMFENMSSQKSIQIVGKKGDQQQTGAGFLNIDDTSPAGQAIQKALGDLAGQGKAQIIVPTTPQNAPAQAGAAGVRAVQTNQGQQQGQQQGQSMQQQVQETSHGEKTINTSFGNETGDYDVEVSYDFDDYGDVEITGVVNIDDGEDMYDVLSGADLDKLKTDVEMQLQADRDDEGDYRYELSRDKLDEISKKTVGDYIKQAHDSASSDAADAGSYHRAKKDTKLSQRTKGIDRAVDKLTGKAKVPANEGAKVDRMVKHIEKSEKKSGKSKEEAQDIAWATANKRGMLDNKNKKKTNENVDKEIADIRKTLNSRKGKVYTPDHPEKKETEHLRRKLAKLVKSKEVKEGDIAPTNGIDTRGAGLGAGRSRTTLEGKKPDFLDLDKDGNKKESMKKAAADKKKQKVKESMNHKLSAARLEGKSHGLRGHAHHGKAYEDLEEMRAYHEGYKEGLDECYGQGVYETAPAMPAATVGGMASQAMPAMEDDMEEGNAFGAAVARTRKGDTFSVGGRTYTDRTDYNAKVDEYAFESLDRQLNALLNEREDLNEGLSVSVSKGQQNSPDSVTITAQDAEADQLLQLVKHAGLGLFGDDQAEPSSAMSVQPSHGEPDEVGAGGVDVEVVDGNDGIMGLMQKLSGIQAAGSDDYEDEEGDEEQLHGNQSHTHEETCNECGGMMEAGHSCGSKMDEEETPDQEEFEVAEDNAPDSDEAETSADEDAEAKEDAALAGEKEEEMNESFASILERLTKLAEGSGDKPKHPEHDEKDDKDFDDAEEEKEEIDEGLTTESLALKNINLEAPRFKMWDDSKGPIPFSATLVQDGRPVGQVEIMVDADAGPDAWNQEDVTINSIKVISNGKEIDPNSIDIPLNQIRAELLDVIGDPYEWGPDNSPPRRNDYLYDLDEEQLDELSPKTLGSYVKKAAKSASNHSHDELLHTQNHDDELATRSGRIYGNRLKGISKAVDKMTAESGLNEWANQVGEGPGKGTDAGFEQDIEFMTKVISGGLNKPKSTGQTTVPVIAGQEDRMTTPKEAVNESINDWVKLAGINKS
jgi:hypothetical protein